MTEGSSGAINKSKTTGLDEGQKYYRMQIGYEKILTSPHSMAVCHEI